MAQYSDKNIAILIPGCGNAHEADRLLKNGFSNITLIDIAPKAVAQLNEKYYQIPEVNIVFGDFFEDNGKYDLMIEQTFFCAIAPSLRKKYIVKSASLLKDNGSFMGLLFNTSFEKQGPPFGGSITEYKQLFETKFIIKKMDDCYNSIPSRANTEVFINLIKK